MFSDENFWRAAAALAKRRTKIPMITTQWQLWCWTTIADDWQFDKDSPIPIWREEDYTTQYTPSTILYKRKLPTPPSNKKTRDPAIVMVEKLLYSGGENW